MPIVLRVWSAGLPHRRDRQPGFTLIELLVVISIIALLIAILLPVLGSARRDAQLIQSMSNLRQIGIASTAYSTDNRGGVPIKGTYRDLGNGPVYAGWCTWSFGGKFADRYWASRSAGVFDLAPSARPLNEYLYDGRLHPPVTGRANEDGPARPRGESERAPIELEVFQSPRDIATLQRAPFGQITPGVSCYDDIGTSYHWNYKWYFQLRDKYGLLNKRAFDQAQSNWQNQVDFQPSRFVLYHDQVTDAITGQYGNNGLSVVDGDFGLENHSAMVFFDGHASFEEVIARENSGDNYDLAFDEE